MNTLLRLSRLTEGTSSTGALGLAKKLAMLTGLGIKRTTSAGYRYFVLYDRSTDFPVIAIYDGPTSSKVFLEARFSDYLEKELGITFPSTYDVVTIFLHVFSGIYFDAKDIKLLSKGARKYLPVIRKTVKSSMEAMRELYSSLKDLENKYPDKGLVASYEESDKYIRVSLSADRHDVPFPGSYEKEKPLIVITLYTRNPYYQEDLFSSLKLSVRSIPGKSDTETWAEFENGGALLKKLDSDVKDVKVYPDRWGYTDVVITYRSVVSPKDAKVLAEVVENNLDLYFQ